MAEDALNEPDDGYDEYVCAEAFRAIRDAGRSNRIIPIPRIMRARPRGRRRRSGARSRARSPGREPDEPHGQALPARGEVAA